jgi:hypothetical protein
VIEEILPGLKRWAGPHPEFNPLEGNLDESYREVGSVVFSGEDALVLIDPLVPDELWPELDAEVHGSGKAVVVLTTIFFHERSRDAIPAVTAPGSAVTSPASARSARSAATRSPSGWRARAHSCSGTRSSATRPAACA